MHSALPNSLPEWLSLLEQRHPVAIDLGLERVAEVARQLGLARPAPHVVTIGGTNGKGSCVALMESILRAAGYRVGAYTSPHLVRFNERARLEGAPLDDATLCAAFARVETARGTVSLTYFEHTTLAVLDEFSRRALDVALLEVGLGGRLDAVNIIDPDVAVVTSIALDHQDWLGNDRESIGAEKAGIFRSGVPAICGDANPPESLRRRAEHLGALWLARGEAFDCQAPESQHWTWSGQGPDGVRVLEHLPRPALLLENAATALQALQWLSLPVPAEAIREGLQTVHLPGRFQTVQYRGQTLILDVAHNPASAQVLADRLRDEPCEGNTHMLFAALSDKDHAGMFQALAPVATSWFLAPPDDSPRAMQPEPLGDLLRSLGIYVVSVSRNLAQALARVLSICQPGDRVVVCGSFHTVGAVLARVEREQQRGMAGQADDDTGGM